MKTKYLSVINKSVKSVFQMMRSIGIIATIILYKCVICHSQKEDYNWVFGNHTKATNAPEYWGVNEFNFNNDPVTIIDNDSIELCNQWTNTSISNIEGKLDLVSNGMHVLGRDFKSILNGDEINKNDFWNIWKSKYADGSIRLEGLRLSQGMLMLPWPEKDSVFYATYNRITIDGSILTEYCKGLFTGIIDVSEDDPMVVLKDYLITEDSLSSSSLQACRHANGRDWWIVAPGHHHNKMYVFLLGPKGINLHHIQLIPVNYPMGIGQASFSPDGSKYVLYEIVNGYIVNQRFLGHITISDFDRSTGLFTNTITDDFSALSFVVGCAISGDSKYMYAANATYLYQYDLQDNDVFATKKTIAISDEFESD